jgi:hypothetical protein
MRRLMMASVALTAAGCATPGGPSGADYADTQMADMMAAQSAAQAAAVRPGDEALTCDQLQAEMTATMNDPKVQAVMADNGASAQAQMDKVRAAQSGAVAGAVGVSALGVASSFVPGLSWFSQGAAMAQQATMAAQARETQRQISQMSGSTMSIMPQMMRGQRIYELASAKSCAFVNQPNPS